MNIYFVLVAMLFLHIIDDYVLQAPCLGNLKQKSWWQKNSPDSQYKYDYIWALLMHSFSWSFMVMLPITTFLNFSVGFGFLFFLVFNTVFHALIDDCKANKRIINLWVDQICHMVQIAGTFTIFVLGGLGC